MKRYKSIIPSPLALAIVLSFVVYILALLYTSSGNKGVFYPLQLLLYYQKGIWDLLTFAMQMMLILVLGNVLALTPLFQRLLKSILPIIHNNTQAVVFTSLFSILLSYFNWGLGLIFSALLARSIGEMARQKEIKINYPLVVAAAYTGMMVWHGGLSGSAPLKVAQEGHFLENLIGVIPVSETIFSTMNISLFVIFLLLLPSTYYLLEKKYSTRMTNPEELPKAEVVVKTTTKRRYLGLSLGLALLAAACYQFVLHGLAALNINMINLILLGLGFVLYANLEQFMNAVNTAIISSSGIMIQFPIYAGIMGLLNYSGLIAIFTEHLVSISSPQTFPLYSFISAAVVNFFVPSGGGQWAVQGPILVDAAQQLGVSIPKTIMALAYGDQLTNMIQPFWALPLLSISGVKAKSILPYTFIVMLVGAIASVVVLMW